jgi:Family of unknown function (DUF5681)
MPCAAISDASRTQAGRFAAGHSGNPAGRPKGARNRATLAAEALLEDNAEALARTLIDASLGGDMTTARFVLGRLYPANAERTITLDVAPGQESDFVHVHARALRAVLGHVSIGRTYSLRHPRESGDPCRWIPAFAGMTTKKPDSTRTKRALTTLALQHRLEKRQRRREIVAADDGGARGRADRGIGFGTA